MAATMTRAIQLGRELTTAAGSAVAATTIWSGEAASIEDLRTVTMLTEHRGRMSPSSRQIQPKLLAGITFPQTVATYEQIVHVLEGGIETCAAAGCGSGYLYTYHLPTTTTNSLITYTIESGDVTQFYEMEYAHVESFSLSGAGGGPVNITSTWRGRQVTSSAKTAALIVPAVNDPIYFGNGKLYLNTTFASLGVTQKTATLLGFKLDVKTGLIPKFTADGALYFTQLGQDGATGTLDLTFEYDATAVVEEVAFAAGTGQYVRLEFNGSALQTSSAPWSTKALRIDSYGKIIKKTLLDTADGNDTMTMTLQLTDDGATNNIQANFYVVNSLATIP
jgi:hypothetical protein